MQVAPKGPTFPESRTQRYTVALCLRGKPAPRLALRALSVSPACLMRALCGGFFLPELSGFQPSFSSFSSKSMTLCLDGYPSRNFDALRIDPMILFREKRRDHRAEIFWETRPA
jgi:hypothetical protein